MNDSDLAVLRSDVQHLKDRAEILECIARHARGCDRHDMVILTDAYHPDGVDEHGATVLAGPDYAAWANAVHAATSADHLHHLTTHTCDICGDEAHAESYVLVTLLSPDTRTATVMSGRYLDRLERREGRWRIALRRATVELAYTADARLLGSRFFLEQGYSKGVRRNDDLSYERPLQLETPAPARW